MVIGRRAAPLLATAAALALALAGAGPAPAAAAIPATGELLSDSAAEPAMTDGRGLLVYRAASGAVVVQDAATGARAEHDAGAACGGAVGELIAFGGGQLLFSCTPAGGPPFVTTYLLLDVASGTVHAPVGADSRVAAAEADEMDASVHFTGVGAFGISYRYQAYHTDSAGRFDWRTGLDAPQSGGGDARVVDDLDVPQLRRTLCEPLRPARDPEEDYGFLAYDYEPPYAVAARPRALVLQRCGRTRETVLTRGPSYAFSLASGFVSWFDRTHRFAYLPACGVRLRWAVPAYSDAAHVAGALVTSERFSDHDPWRIRVVRLDGACERVAAARRLAVSAGAGEDVEATARLRGFVDPASGGTAVVAAARGQVAAVRVRAGERVALVTGAPARYVRWRADGGRLRAATGGGRRWSLRAPAQTRSRLLSVRVRFRSGGAARFAVRLTGTGR